jgi:hypothetical protein
MNFMNFHSVGNHDPNWTNSDFSEGSTTNQEFCAEWHCHSGTTHQLFVRCFQRSSGISGRDIKLENIMLARVRRGDIFAPRRLDSSQRDAFNFNTYEVAYEPDYKML